MDRRDIRSDLPRFSTLSAQFGATLRSGKSIAAMLTRKVGRALGSDQRLAGSGGVERLEERTLLAGNSFANATVLSATDATGRLFSADNIASASEADFYRFTLQPNHFAGILADTANQTPTSNLNTRIEVYSSTQQLISSSTNNGTVTSGLLSDGWVNVVNNASTPQDFFVVVRGEGASTGSYTVRVRANNTLFDIGGETNEVGVSREFGSPTPDFTVQPPTLPVPVLGQLGGTNPTIAQRIRQDEIVYAWTVPNQAKWANLVTINAQALSSAPQNRRLDTRIEVYNNAGTQVAFDAEAGRLNDAFATFVPVPGQTYFIRVRSDEVRNPNIEFATGPFFLLIDGITTDLNDANQVTDPMDNITNRAQDNGFLFALYDEPTNPPAPDFNGGASDAPTFHTASYKFVAAGSGLAIITAIPEPNPFLTPKVTDPALTIYDEAGTQIAFNNNLIGLNAEVRVQLLGGKTYYIVLDGFAIGNGIFYQLTIEANHIFETNGVDDHPNRPADLGSNPTADDLDQRARNWQIATALPWGQPFLTLDANNNPLRDRGLRVASTASGRIFNSGDTDIFQFTPPTDMLGTHSGNNDDNGNSLFVGGRYEVSDPGTRFPVTSRNLSTWDAGDFWYVGPQFFDPTPSVTYGIQNNPDTAGTPDAEIYVMYDWTPTAANGTTELPRRLAIGGDFLLLLPNPLDPTTPISIKNFAIWQFIGGQWTWNTADIPALPSGDLGINGPVRAMVRFDPENSFDPDGQGPAPNVDTSSVLDALYIGGAFSQAGPVAADNLVSFRIGDGFISVAGSNGFVTGPVFALATYNAPDPGAGRAAQTTPPILAEVLDVRDLPISLYIGGAFGNGVVGWDGNASFQLAIGEKPIGSTLPNLVPGVGLTGGQPIVRSLTTFTFDPDRGGDLPAREVLAVGGRFNRAGGAVANNFAIWGQVDIDPIASDPQQPDYYPKLLWDAPINAGGGDVFTMKSWQRPRLNNEADPPPAILALGGEFTGFIKGWDGIDGAEVDLPGFQGLGIVDGPVYALEISATRNSSGNGLDRDTQEPGIRENLDSGDAQIALYAGGAFTQYQANPFSPPVDTLRVATIVAGTGPQGADDFMAPNSLAGGVDRLDPNTQPDSRVFALASFDDGDPNTWDRHDRISTRLDIAVAPTSDAFINLRVRVYDSNFRAVYDFSAPGSETISLTGPDPAGMIDTSLLGRDPASVQRDQFRGITVWGGETYYIEVLDPRGGFGRYDLTIVADAGPQPLQLDITNQFTNPGSMVADTSGFVGDINLLSAQEEGFNGGELLGDAQGGVRNLFPSEIGKRSGDDDITAQDVGSAFNVVATGGLVPAGNQRQIRRITPSTGTAVAVGADLGVISSINDVDVYSFRATYTGNAEIRINTANYLDQYGESSLSFPDDATTTAGSFVGLPTINPLSNPSDSPRRSSRLDAALRILRNDLSQIDYSDDSAVIRPNAGGGLDRRFVGGQGQGAIYPIGIDATNPVGMVPYSFRKNDPRVVFPIEQNRVYFILVESAQKYKNGRPEFEADRVLTPADQIDWREATGGYNLVVNQMPDFQNLLGFSDIVNGQRITDDHYDFVQVRGSDLDSPPNGNGASFQPAVGGYSTPISIGEDPADPATNGRGSIAGVIVNTPAKPRDLDTFKFAVPANGRATIRLDAAQFSGLDARFNLYRENATNPTTPLLISSGSVQPDGSVTYIIDNAVQGEEYIIEVFAQGSTQGAYTVSVVTQPFADDHASASKWSNATDVPIVDFRGAGSASGTIAVPGDTDIFKFAITDWDRATISVQPIDLTLTPRVTVYQVNETFIGTELVTFFQRIGEGTGSPATTVVTVTPDRTGVNPTRSYDFYYVVVEGRSPRLDSGRYNLLINITPTDDYADGDSNSDNVFDTGEFPIAAPFTLDNFGLGTLTGNIEVDSDSDLFTFSVPATGDVTVTITRPTNSTLRPRLTLLRPDASIITQVQAPDSVNFTSLAATITLPRNSQVFVVVDGLTVTGSNPVVGKTGRYSVNVQVPPLDDHANALEWSIATPIAISTGTGRGQVGSDAGSPLNPRINYVGDSDLFSFTVIRAGNQTVTVTPLTSALGLIAPRLRIYISTNLTTPIADVNATAAGGDASFTIVGALVSAQYFVLVSAQTGVTGASDRGDYRVSIVGPVPSNPQPQDPAEVDFNNPTTITINPRTGDGSLARTTNSQSPEINPADDRDLYNFTVAAAGRVFVRLSRPSGSLLSATMQVFRRNPNNTITEIPVVIDNRAGSIAYTEFGSAANVEYFVIVDGLGPSTGGYNLEINSTPSVNRLVYPEGFSGDNVFEFIPLVNPNPFPITYTLTLYYEFDQVINNVTVSTSSVTRTISANARDGITVWQPTGNPDFPFYSDIRDAQSRPLVARNAAFTMVVEWQNPTVNPLNGSPIDPLTIQPLGATSSHYDFGSSTGDAFTEKVATTWTFPRVERQDGSVLNFVLFWNPNNFAVRVGLTAYLPDGTVRPLPEVVVAQPNRRSGFGIFGLPSLAGINGIFSVVLTSAPIDPINNANFEGVVSSLTAYRTGSGNESAFGIIGDAEGGSTRGAVTRITNFSNGTGATSDVTFFNPGNSPATVTLTGRYVRTDIPSFARTFQVPAGRTVTFSGSSLGLQQGQSAGLSYTSSVPVSMQSYQLQRGDADSASPTYTAGNRFLFGDAFINIDRAGVQYFETLSFYNPASSDITVSILLTFADRVTGRTNSTGTESAQSTLFVTIPAGGFSELRLHENQAILGNRKFDGNPGLYYGIEIVANSPFMVSMEHYDLLLGGGWAANGVPFGILTPLSQIGS